MPDAIDVKTLVRRYFDAIEAGDPEGNLAFFAPDVIQEEFPNRLVPNGATRDLAALRDAAVRGGKVTVSQRYDIRNILVAENRAAVEVTWTAILAVPVGTIPAGGEMRARFAIFLEFRDGKIIRQHNYDCFDPF